MARPRSPSAESAESFTSGECDVSQYRCAIRYRTHQHFSPVCEDNPPLAVSAGCAVNAHIYSTSPPAASSVTAVTVATAALDTQSAVTAEDKKRGDAPGPGPAEAAGTKKQKIESAVTAEPGPGPSAVTAEPSAASAEAAGYTAKKRKTDAS